METKTSTTQMTLTELVNHYTNTCKIDYDMFYSVSFRSNSICLQGKLSKTSREYCEKELGCTFQLTKSDWIESIEGSLCVTLTW